MALEKSVLLSKTFWCGLLMAASPLIPSVGAWMNSNGALVASIWGGVTIALRLVTKDKVVLLP